MKRRIILMTVAFLSLLLIFGLYKLAKGSSGAAKPRQQLARPTVNFEPTTKAGPKAESGEELYWESRSKDNWLEGTYKAKQWQSQKDGSYQLVKPLITLYQRNSQEVHISADDGNVYIEEVGSNRRIRRGTLSGNVKIILDQSTTLPHTDMSQRPEDLVTISLDDMTLRDDLLEMTTDNSVDVTSSQADMHGRGLSITWNEQPRELRELRLEHGREIVIKNIPEYMTGMGRSTGKAAATTTADSGEATTTLPTEAVEAKSPPAKPTGKSTSKSTSKPTTPPAANQYCAVLTDASQGLNVVSGGRKLLNVGELALTFDTGKKSSTGRRQQSTTTQPGSAKTLSPQTQSQEPPSTMTVTWVGPLILRPVGYTATPVKDRVDILAKGDNLIVSDSQSLTNSGTIHCNEVEFHSPQQVSYIRGKPGTMAVLEMAGGDRIESGLIEMGSNGGKNSPDLVRLHGPGKMIRTSGGGMGDISAPLAKATTQADSTASTQPQTPDVITWQKGVLAHFVSAGSGKTYLTDATFDGKVELYSGTGGNYVKGDHIETVFGRTAEGKSYISSATVKVGVDAKLDDTRVMGGDVMTVVFKLTPVVKAGKTIFEDKPDTIDTAGNPVVVTDDSDPKTPVRAQGGRIYCISKSQDATVAIKTAGRRQPRSTDMAVTLYGQETANAEVHAGPNSIIGPKIYLDKVEDMAFVEGAGSITFLSNQDMQGNAMAQPQLVSTEWAESMEYKGNGGVLNNKPVGPYARFVGDVAMRMGTEFMSGGQMTAYFQPKPAATEPAMPIVDATRRSKSATKPASTEPVADRRIGIGMDSFSKLKIMKVDARDNVMLSSEHADAAGKVVQSMQIRAKDGIVYDFASKQADIDCPGSFLIEDYRPNEAATDAASSAKAGANLNMMGQKLDRPNQMAGSWSKSMQWLQAPTPNPAIKGENIITMNGNARIELRSGKEIVVEKPDASLKTGRKSHVYGDRIETHFAPEDKPTVASPTDGAAKSAGGSILDKGMGIGQLSKFIVTGAEVGEPQTVDIQDGTLQVYGRQVNFERQVSSNSSKNQGAGLLEVWGYLNLEKHAMASVTTTNASTGKSNPPTQSPYIKCILRDGKVFSIEAADISGGAAR